MSRIAAALSLLLASLLVVEPGVGHAQPCLGLTPEGGALGYRQRANSTRCEGFYQQPSVGTAGVELVSLTYGELDFDSQRHRSLNLGLAQPPEGQVRILGQIVTYERFYRLDAVIDSNTPLIRIALGDVIGPARLGKDKLGLYAYRSVTAGAVELIPIVVVPDTQPVVPQTRKLRVVLRPGIDVTGLRWRLRDGQGARPYEPVPGAASVVVAGSSLPFTIDPPRTDSARLDLKFFTTSGQELSDSIRIALR